MNARQRRTAIRSLAPLRAAMLSGAQAAYPVGSEVVNIQTGKPCEVLNVSIGLRGTRPVCVLHVKRRDNRKVFLFAHEVEKLPLPVALERATA